MTRIDDILRELGIDVVSRDLSPLNELPLPFLQGYDELGNVVARSCGKGVGLFAAASGKYELAEHFFIDSNRWDLGTVNRVTVDDALSGFSGQLWGGLAMLDRDAERDRLIDTVEYVGVSSGESVLYPVFLRDGGYVVGNQHRMLELAPFSRYSSNVGIAAGSDLNEALLHALCEVIEHDSFSEAIFSWFMSDFRASVRLVAPGSFDGLLERIYASTSSLYPAGIEVVDIRSGFAGIPAYVAIGRHEDCEIPMVGLGCSLDARYAVERALLELRQAYYVNMEDVEGWKSRDSWLLANGGRVRWIREALRLDFSEQRTHPVSLSPDLPEVVSVASAVDDILSRLARRGASTFYRIVYECEGLVVVDVLSAGLETFDLVREGALTPPLGRLRN